MAIERSDASGEDAENVTEQPTVERRIPPDRPGTEPPGLSRADGRAAAKAANEQATAATVDDADEPKGSPSCEGTPNGHGSDRVQTEEDDERDTADAIGDEQPDRPDTQEATPTGWDTPEISDHPKRPETSDIRLAEDRRSHILDGEPGNRGGHRHGTGNLGKTEFPADWDDDTTVRHIIDVARRPDSVEMQGHGTWKVRGERDGVDVVAIVKPDGQIRTAFPLPGGKGVVQNPEE